MKMGEGIGVMQLQTKECQGLQGAMGSQKEARKRSSLEPSECGPGTLQNCERTLREVGEPRLLFQTTQFMTLLRQPAARKLLKTPCEVP